MDIFNFFTAAIPIFMAKIFARWTYSFYVKVGLESFTESQLVIIFMLIGVFLVSFELLS